MPQRLLLFCLLLFPFLAQAQLTIVNPTDRPVNLALGFYVEKGLWKGWNTKGWFALAPHDSTTLLPEGIAGGSFYYYGRVTGCDQRYEGAYALTLHQTDAFAVSNATSPTPLTLNKGVEQAGFVKVTSQTRTYRLLLPFINCTQQGKRTGDWQVYLDRDKEEVSKVDQAMYVRHITYQMGQPAGLVRDYYKTSNNLHWEGKLLSEHPLLMQGTCTTYDEGGRKKEEAVYAQGKITGPLKRWDATGKEQLVKKTLRTVRIISPQQGYLFSYFNPGASRTVVPIRLPANTVSWYYEFAAFRDKAQLEAAQHQFQLFAQLSTLADQSGITSFAINALTKPPGGNICNVYLLADSKQCDLFRGKQTFNYVREGTRDNLTSAVVPVGSSLGQEVALGLYNPDNMYGIHYALEVVAVVEE